MIIHGARLIDGTGNDPLENSLVEMSGSEIEWVGTVSKYGDLPGDEELIDAEGYTLLPGLINCHVHLAMDGQSPHHVLANASPAEEGFRALRNAANTLLGGVTTVRDCGARTRAVKDLSDAIDSGDFHGPRILTCGRGLTTTGGHAHWMCREVDGADEIRKGVREEIKQGADWLKVMATGGVSTPGTDAGAPTFTEDELRVAVETARQAGKAISAHAIGNAGIKNALRAGVDCIEHASYLDRETLELLKESRATHVPTLSSFHQVATHGEDSGLNPRFVQRTRKAAESNRNSFQMSRQAGVKLAAGTDAGVPLNYHGGIGLELKLMVEAGASPMESIVIATRNAASILGLEEQVGTVEVGKKADLVLVEDNPLKDPLRLNDPWKVIKDGQVVPDPEAGDNLRPIWMNPGKYL